MSGTVKGSVLVLDATGCIGRAVVRAALDQGLGVIAVASERKALEALKAENPGADLSLLPGSVRDEVRAERLAADLRALGRSLSGIVTGGCREPTRGRVLEDGVEVLRRHLEDELIPHLAAARALVPLLAEAGRNGSYVVIGGPGSEQPWAGYGHRSISAAAKRMLLRVLHDEAHSLGVRVQLLAVESPARTEENQERACAQWPSAEDIALRALELLDPTESRVPAEAVVRYAWPTPSPLATRRDRNTARPARAPSSAMSAKRPDAVASKAVPHDPSPIPSLDDTWALLKPLLANNSKKGSTP